MLKAALAAGVDRWFYDEVYAANRELQECLFKAGEEKDPATAQKSHDECIARFKERLKAAEESVTSSRRFSAEVIKALRATPSQPLPK